jgi:hypothetical protein
LPSIKCESEEKSQRNFIEIAVKISIPDAMLAVSTKPQLPVRDVRLTEDWTALNAKKNPASRPGFSWIAP